MLYNIMSKTKTIEHKGIVEEIVQNKVRVKFLAVSACASCHAKGACSAADMEDKHVDVYDFSGDFKIGDQVNVIMSQGLGFRALLFGYVYPFLIVLFTLIILTSLGTHELSAGIAALSTLIPYYIILNISKNKLRKTFSFTLKKLD